MVTKGETVGGGINSDVRINIYLLLHIKQVTRTSCIAQGNLLKKKKGYMHMYN